MFLSLYLSEDQGCSFHPKEPVTTTQFKTTDEFVCFGVCEVKRCSKDVVKNGEQRIGMPHWHSI